MNFSQFLYLLYIFLLPIDEVGPLAFNVGGLHVTILDVILLILLYLVLSKQFVAREYPGKYIYYICICLVIAFPFSIISFIYLPHDNIMYDIKISLVLFEFSALIYITADVIKNLEFLNKVIHTFVLSCLLVSIATILKSIGLPIYGSSRVLTSTIGPFTLGHIGIMHQALGLSIMICVALPFVINYYLNRRNINILLVFFIILMATLITYSRGLWIAVGFQIYIYLALIMFCHNDILKRFTVGLILFVITICTLLTGPAIYSLLSQLREATVIGRMEGYFDGINLLVSNPIFFVFGAGKGHFVTVYGDGTTMVHNFILDLLVSKGILTVIAVIAAFFIIAKRFQQNFQRNIVNYNDISLAYISAFAGLFIMGLSAPFFTSIHFWTFFAITCAYLELHTMELRWER